MKKCLFLFIAVLFFSYNSSFGYTIKGRISNHNDSAKGGTLEVAELKGLYIFAGLNHCGSASLQINLLDSQLIEYNIEDTIVTEGSVTTRILEFNTANFYFNKEFGSAILYLNSGDVGFSFKGKGFFELYDWEHRTIAQGFGNFKISGKIYGLLEIDSYRLRIVSRKKY